MTIRKTALVAALAAGAAALPAAAHHSAAMFDDAINMPLQGVVTRFDYLNPHSWLYVNVTNEDGSVTEWGFELDAPPRLRRVGVGPNNWVEGDEVEIITNPLRDGRPAGNLVASRNATQGNEFGDVELFEAAAEVPAEGGSAGEEAELAGEEPSEGEAPAASE
jgi:hypothetical protein